LLGHFAPWKSAFKGSVMPPPEAVKDGKVKPLTDEDRRTLLRWIDLGCPIDLDYDPKNPGDCVGIASVGALSGFGGRQRRPSRPSQGRIVRAAR
jgi:hypothetical protein